MQWEGTISILNGLFKDRETMEAAVQQSIRALEEAMPQLDEKIQDLFKLTADGSTLGDALGITKDQKAALLNLGCQLILVGELEKAFDVLLRLNQLDPYEERSAYALGVICQTRGEWQKAAQCYLQFLALDATNPAAYLRLAECLYATREFREAYDAAAMAKEFAGEGKGRPGNLDEAKRLLELPEIAEAARSATN